MTHDTATDDPTDAYIRRWHGIVAPNEPARRMAAQLADTIADFAALRAVPAMLAPPGDFAATLIALRDRMEG